MEKIKVGVLAKDLNKTPKELLTLLKELKIPAKTSASLIDLESVKTIKDFLLKEDKVKKEKNSEIPKSIKKAEIKKENLSKPTETIVEDKKTGKLEPALSDELNKKTIESKQAIDIPSVVQSFQPQIQQVKQIIKPSIIIPADGVILKDFAEKLKVKSSDIIKELMKKGVLVTLNQKISAEIAIEIGTILSFDIKIEELPSKAKKEEEEQLSNEDKKQLKIRPPVVTIMGHVDHGKTKLLDAIRSTKVAESEAGGITQHIGAYQVSVNGRKITFLDTPGHEAFTALRARGAKVTDIAILVVAADDGVMPQTIEAIDHAKAADVPIIVALNKIDKPEANPDRVKQQLSEHGLQPEEWGGQTVTVPVSAKQKTGIDELLEMILLVADMQELKANPESVASGVVIEARLEKGRGPVASVLIKNGTLRVGDIFVVGNTTGRVRAIISDKGERLKKALPSTPIELLGASFVPSPGDMLYVMEDERKAKEVAEKNKAERASFIKKHIQTLEDFSKVVEDGEKKDLKLILKADVQGSLEALVSSLLEITVENRRVQIIHSGVGNIAESDVLLAEASDAILIGFHVEIDSRAKEVSESENVSVKIYDIIYKLLDNVKKAMEGMLTPEYEEVIVGKAEVRSTFRYSKVGVIAGCIVLSGKLIRGAGLRILRNNQKIYEGKLESLKRFKDDVKEVLEGYECGVAIVGYEDFQVGDIIEAFEEREKSRK